MKCSNCAHENRTGARFCEECAVPLERACAYCGAQLAPTAKFCSECAHPAGLAPPPMPPTAPRFGAPEAYTPRHLAEKILTSKAALEGERKQVTVLFADVKDSMELLADRDPEETRSLLDPILEHMMEAVHRFEGTVNQVMGDGIMALFGAPLAHEDHAIRACYAALRMQETVKRYAEGVRRSEGVLIRIRVGLNSGKVVGRSIGSDLRMDYTAVGQTTNVAARMEQMTVPGSILISADTLTLAEGYVQVKPLGPLKVKGLDLPVEVFEIVGASTVRSRLRAAAARGLTRFVGRDGEVDQLHQALERARTGHGQVVAVVGEPGVGKSRLYWEFTRSHRTHGWLIAEGSSVSYGKPTAFLPIIDLLRAYFQIEAGDEARRIREKVTGKLDRSLGPSLPALLWLLDVPIEDPQWQRLDPPQRRQRALEGVKRLLLMETQVQPVLVLFEDLQWIDAETQALLDGLVESLPTARLLLLVNYRPEYTHAWSSKTYYRQLSIDPLPAASAEELLVALLGNDSGLQPLKRLLIERTDGNPFFLEESVRTLVEAKDLSGERGAYHLETASHSPQIPATVQAILAARIDRLPAEDKQLLHAASAIGKEVPFTLLQAIAELPEESLRRGLAHLQAAEFLYEAQLFPDLEYTFKHALTHDVAYGSLLRSRRRSLHTRIMAAIEHLHPDRLRDYVDQLAHHAFRGEAWGKAVTYHRQAGAKAFARSANREAVGHFEQALTALTHIPETREKLEQAIDINFDLRNALYPLAELGRIERCLRDAQALAGRLEDQRRLGWVSAYMCSHHWATGGHAVDVRTFARAVDAIAATLGDAPLQIVAQYYHVAACHIAGDYRETEHSGRRLMQSLEGDSAHERFGVAIFPAVLCRVWLAFALGERGVFDEGDAHGHEATRVAEALDSPYSLCWAFLGLAQLQSLKGELNQAARLLERAVTQCRDWNFTLMSPMVMAPLGHVYAWSGRLEEGVSWLRQAVTAYEAAGVGWRHSISVAQLGEAYLLADRAEDARACADRAVTLARERGERGYEAWALRLLAEVASHGPRPEVETAKAHYGTSMALASELEMRPLVAHCHLGLCRLCRQTGKREQAHEHLTTATTMYRDMNMRFWLQKAEAEMTQLG
jgi:class 3 adenylate cyclase/tetratricopeptide (TPR) repeat protein